MAGIYLHIPFCHSKCSYCDFFSTPNDKYKEAYLQALESEFSARQTELAGEPVNTIYLGGGTPSILSPSELDRLFSWLPLEWAEEITLEVNPEDVTPQFSEWLSQSAVNRVSMGLQTLCDSELAFIGRRHSARDALNAFHMLRNCGMTNISLDLMLGLPGQTLESWKHSLQKTLELSPEHLSAYTLMLEPGTRLWAMAQSGKYTETDDSVIEQMYTHLCTTAEKFGFQHYEISNFAKPHHQSAHNSAYWNLTPYLGLGTGAHSFDGKVRRFNPNNLRDYIKSPASYHKVDAETPTEQLNDYIMIRLRTAKGILLHDFEKRFGEPALCRLLQKSKKHVTNQNLKATDHCIAIPENRFLVSDSIIADLMD